MNGAKVFYDDLLACGLMSNEDIQIVPAFHKLSSYVNKSSTGNVEGVNELSSPEIKGLIEGKHILVVEDTFDSGTTMECLDKTLKNL